MREIFENFSLLCAMLVKVALVTGIGPGIAIFYVAEKLVEADRVPTREQWEMWQARVKQFLSWGERTAPGKMMDLPVISSGAGARPVNFREVA